MQKPNAPAGCPPGLEYLTAVDQLLIKQVKELLESKYQHTLRYYITLHYITLHTAKFQVNPPIFHMQCIKI